MRKMISAATLKKYNACQADTDRFIEEFGYGRILINRENVRRALLMNIEWFLLKGLTRDQFSRYCDSRRRVWFRYPKTNMSEEETQLWHNKKADLLVRWLQKCK